MNLESFVKSLIDNGEYSYASMSKYLGISSPTLYTRLVKGDWKKGEIELILKLKRIRNEESKI